LRSHSIDRAIEEEEEASSINPSPKKNNKALTTRSPP
jgi:hypothetical protein